MTNVEEVLPQHGIKLVVINYFDFGTSKRILRNKAYDIKVVRNLLKEYIPKKQSKAKKKNNTPSTTEINITQALEVVSKPQEKKNVDIKTLLKRKRANVRDYSIEQRCLILSKYLYNEDSGVIYRTANEEDEYLKGVTIYPTSEQLNNEFNLSSCKQLKDSANINDFNADQIAEITCAGYEYDFLSGEIYRINEDYENEDEYDNEFDYEDCFTNQYGDPYFIYDKNNYNFPTTEQLYKELNLGVLESTEQPSSTLTISEKIRKFLNKKLFVFNFEITLLNCIILIQICTIIWGYFFVYCDLNETYASWLTSIAITYISFRNKSFLVFAILTVAFCLTAFFLGLLI